MNEAVIEVRNLHKQYGGYTAVNDISFTVRRGEIFGIIGPNGAGKTSIVETLIGLRHADRGLVRVLGFNPITQRLALSQRIGIQLQEAQLFERLKVWEVLDLFAILYQTTISWEPLIMQWGLGEKRNTFVGKLSGGQKQRLFIALALLHNPEIVFLDELTTGLDPQARRSTWEMIQAIREQGKTVVLVTHFMDEAELLCDRIAIVDDGRIMALDTPQALIESLPNESRVLFTPPAGFKSEWLADLAGVTHMEMLNGKWVVYGRGSFLSQIVLSLSQHGITLSDLQTEQATLEDVFISLTGHKIRA
ncbi:MAG: ABC transporter ATP-binding protein [Chloroflexi bacterium]|nr:ABC transporter ATP-binding protein [Chloroflexota bacterium]